MKQRGGPVGQAVSRPPFPLIEAHILNAPKPLICMAVLEAVYLFCLLLVCTEGRYVNQIFRAVRKLPQRVANGTRFARGGCSGNHWQSMFRLPASGDLRMWCNTPNPQVMSHLQANPVQGFLFSILFLAIIFTSISHNSEKTLESLSDWIAKNGKISLFSQNIFEKPLSLAQIRHDYFGMSSRTNIRQPGKPATEGLSIEAKGELYDHEGRRSQKSS